MVMGMVKMLIKRGDEKTGRCGRSGGQRRGKVGGRQNGKWTK